LRHEIIEKFDLDTYGRGYNPIKYKGSLKDYKYQVVVENVKSDHWFTEKIIDCFLTGTIPIYWGANKIHKYFNTDGIIEFHTLARLKEILNNLPEVKESVLRENFEKAKYYSCCENQIYDRIKKANYL